MPHPHTSSCVLSLTKMHLHTQEETRVWDSHGMHRVHGIAELVARVSEMTAWIRADEDFPKVLSKAYTDDGGWEYKEIISEWVSKVSILQTPGH